MAYHDHGISSYEQHLHVPRYRLFRRPPKYIYLLALYFCKRRKYGGTSAHPDIGNTSIITDIDQGDRLLHIREDQVHVRIVRLRSQSGIKYQSRLLRAAARMGDGRGALLGQSYLLLV